MNKIKYFLKINNYIFNKKKTKPNENLLAHLSLYLGVCLNEINTRREKRIYFIDSIWYWRGIENKGRWLN